MMGDLAFDGPIQEFVEEGQSLPTSRSPRRLTERVVREDTAIEKGQTTHDAQVIISGRLSHSTVFRKWRLPTRARGACIRA